MEQYIKYIIDKDRELIFSPKYEEEIIPKILGDTKGYRRLVNKNNEETLSVEWTEPTDPYLATFSFNMFIRSKKIMPVDLDEENFIILWDNYTMTPDYFIQVANYMLNSDDYKSGARIKMKSEEVNNPEFPNGNLGQNMRDLQASFQGHPEKESEYVQKMGTIGTELFSIVNSDLL